MRSGYMCGTCESGPFAIDFINLHVAVCSKVKCPMKCGENLGRSYAEVKQHLNKNCKSRNGACKLCLRSVKLKD